MSDRRSRVGTSLEKNREDGKRPHECGRGGLGHGIDALVDKADHGPAPLVMPAPPQESAIGSRFLKSTATIAAEQWKA
jgi:hypothetical protein